MGAGSILAIGTPTELHSTGQRSLHVVDHALPSAVLQQRTQRAIDQRALQPRDAEGKEHLVVPDVAPTLYAGREHLGDNSGPPFPPSRPPSSPSPPTVPPMSQRTWMDTADPPAVRAAKLLQHMNFTEKTMMLHARDSEDDQMGFYIGLVETSTRLGMPWLRLNDGPQGFNDYGKHPGTTTNWPSGLTIAASFDLEMARLWGESMGAEFRGKGANVQLGPGLCVARLPLNGRNFEYMSGEVRERRPSLGRSKSLVWYLIDMVVILVLLGVSIACRIHTWE